MAIGKRLRYEILKRDNYTCRYCGASAPDVKLTVDHVMPVALGGTDEPSNLATACADCNTGKASVPADAPTVADASERQLKWAAALKDARAKIEADKRKRRRSVAFVLDAWPKPLHHYLPADWETYVQQWLDEGMTKADISEAIVVALGASHVPPERMWVYAAGVLARKTRELHQAARDLLDEEGN